MSLWEFKKSVCIESRIKLLQADNEKKKSENQQLKGKEIELLKKEIELKEEREEMNLKLQKEVMKKRDEFKALGLKEAESKFELEKLEMQKQIEDQKKLAAEMKRKMVCRLKINSVRSSKTLNWAISPVAR